MIDEFFDGSGAAFGEGFDDSGFEGRIFLDRFDRFGADEGLAGGGGAIVVAIELGEEGFDVFGGLGEVLAIVNLGANFVASDAIACVVVAEAVLIDGGRHGLGGVR